LGNFSERKEEVKKAVITGLGIVCPAGSTEIDVINTIKSGLCPIHPIPDARIPDGQKAVGAIIPNVPERKERANNLLIKSCETALKQAGYLDFSKFVDCAIIVGTSLGDIDSAIISHENSSKHDNSSNQHFKDSHLIVNAPHNLAQAISDKFNLRGPRLTLSCACTSGTSGMGLALDWIRLGRIKRCLVTAVDTINDFVLCGFSSLWALTSSPPKPFDTARTGMALGETAVAFMVEACDERESNKKSASRNRAVIEGYGASCDAVHITAPDRTGAGAERAINEAIADAGWTYKDVEYLNVHGTGSLYNDSMILKAIDNVFKERATTIPISSVNPCTGHTLGAAGLTELFATILATESHFIPPTPNLTAPERDDMNLVTVESIITRATRSISLTTGFGGANTALAITTPSKKYEAL
jgi:3-oxoacyl-[acyl-carrier-protein] synthase II